jgi:CheY-like chemotaxis protein
MYAYFCVTLNYLLRPMNSYRNLILLADDDIDDQEIIKEIFASHATDLTIMTVDNGEEALHALQLLHAKHIAPCLIILDLNMPKMNGRQTLLRIKAQPALQHVPIVLFSTSNNPSDKEFARMHGADYVIKPFSYENMEGVVKGFIDQCEPDTVKH